MKRLLTSLLVCILSASVFAQTNIPQLVNFSAVVRDPNNNPLVNTPVSLRLSFRSGGQFGPLVYCALHQDVTNANGFISFLLNRNVLATGCNGAPSTPFNEIPWNTGGYWMQVEYQTVPSNPFVDLGQLELASSFYAFSARTAERLSNFDLSGAQNGYLLTFNISSGQWEPMPPAFNGNYNNLTNAPQNLSAFGNDVGYITSPNDADSDPTNELQDWNSLPGIPAGFADGVDNVDDADNVPTNEIQNMSVSLTGDTLFLSGGNWVIIPGISALN